MKPELPERKKRSRGFTALLIFSNLLLCLALAASVFLTLRSERREDQRAAAAMAQADNLQKELEEAQSHIDELEATTIPIETSPSTIPSPKIPTTGRISPGKTAGSTTTRKPAPAP